MPENDLDQRLMRRALDLAVRGEGLVEPNPMVGSVVARGDRIVGEGWHERFGGPHAEVNALAAAGDKARGATLYATLEPCRHTGKTPPCTAAIQTAGVARVVVAARDPFPEVDGGGIAELRSAGVEVVLRVLEDEALAVLAPYRKLITNGLPWGVAKWAMTLDGKIATRTGSSQWISSEASRRVVHELRGRVDAVIVGRRTVITDDPLLTARPPGPRVATRVVLGAPPREAKLFETLEQAPLLIVAGNPAEAEGLAWVVEAGGEVITVEAEGNAARFTALMRELGRRRMTNVLIEGGAQVLGAAFDAGMVDEAHVFIGPKLVGGQPAPSPVGGAGIDQMSNAAKFEDLAVKTLGGDAYLHGRLRGPGAL